MPKRPRATKATALFSFDVGAMATSVFSGSFCCAINEATKAGAVLVSTKAGTIVLPTVSEASPGVLFSVNGMLAVVSSFAVLVSPAAFN